MTVVERDFKQALRHISIKQYGLSLGDRACLALAKSYGTLVMTADKIWEKLNINGIEIQVIR